MAYRVADVPLIPQQLNMACWFASAQMLIQWRQARRRACEAAHRDPAYDDTLVARHQANDGLAVALVADLAQRLGLRQVPPMSPTTQAVEGWLRRFGPLWFAGLFPSGHVVVITGIDEAGLSINDPWPPKKGSRRVLSMPDFVRVLQPLGGATLASNFLHFPD